MKSRRAQTLEQYEIIRGEEEWQRAGAYSVRIEGMNRQHHISLREEFDEHDTEGTKYIILLAEGYPIATCRFYETDKETVTLGRVVVLPEHRGKKLGRKIVSEAELWAGELGYREIVIDSRVEAIPFYEKLGYVQEGTEVIQSGNFDCIRMRKDIARENFNEHSVRRIREMEQILNEAMERIDQLEEAKKAFEQYQEEIQKLEAYYGSEDWKKDFALDEAGALPTDLKRGVLSEDGVYNLLECCKGLMKNR